MKTLLYRLFKILIKTQFFFYAKEIKILGKENIPKKGAILFTANHPNGLLDPLLIASSIKRKTHFLVRADVFKNPKIAIIFDWLGMMPIYRKRDGIRQVNRNNIIFEKCRNLLKNGKQLLIFPEGSHSKKRTIRPLSKGFTRIAFGTLSESSNIKMYIIPVGITYQNSSKYPSKIVLQFDKPILANDFYNVDSLHKSSIALKQKISERLKKLTVHIDYDENFIETEKKLHKLDIDYTDVDTINKIIKTGNYSTLKVKRKPKKSLLKYLIIINSFIPYLIWKKLAQKNKEIEFVDTFRLGINTLLFPFFYSLQTFILSYIFNFKIGVLYFFTSLILVISHTKTGSTS